jgi:hypothetical protein
MKNPPEFGANYVIHSDRDLPSGGKAPIQFPPGREGIGLDGPLLSIELSDRTTWLAVLSGGFRNGNFVDGIFHTPDPDTVCLVTCGRGYWVNTISRTSLDIPRVPIRQIEATPDIMMFADFSNVSAFGKEGLLWTSGQLVSDRLSIQNVNKSADIVTCIGWDDYTQAEVTVRLDLGTGRPLSEG